MKTLKKCFSVAGDRKSRLSFATFVICGIILLAVPLQISCSDSGDDSGDSIVEGGGLTETIPMTLSKLPWKRALRLQMLTS